MWPLSDCRSTYAATGPSKYTLGYPGGDESNCTNPAARAFGARGTWRAGLFDRLRELGVEFPPGAVAGASASEGMSPPAAMAAVRLRLAVALALARTAGPSTDGLTHVTRDEQLGDPVPLAGRAGETTSQRRHLALPQLGVNGSTRSMTNTSTGPRCDSSLRPSCS